MKQRYQTARKDFNALNKISKQNVTKVAKKAAKSVFNGLVEKKYRQHTHLALSASATIGWAGNASDIPQGIGNGSRDGDRVIPQRVKFTLTLYPGDSYNLLRILYVRYKDNDLTSSFGAPKVLSVGPTGLIDINSQYNYDNKQNYDVLWDHTYTMVAAADTNVRHITKTIKLGKTPIIFNPAALTGTNRFFFLYVSDSALVPHCAIDMSTTFWYTDA